MDKENVLSDVDVVHPELYSKCRLCIIEVGQVRTLPNIQEKIKFCFDIMVMPNDYLPQLLCLKCSNILANYCEVKKKYLENQKILEFKLNPLKDEQTNEEKGTQSEYKAQLDLKSDLNEKESLPSISAEESLLQTRESKNDSTEHETADLEAPDSPKISTKGRSTSSNSNSTNEKNKKSLKTKGKRKRLRLNSASEDDFTTTPKTKDNEVLNRSWKSLYRKKIVCRFCGKDFQTKRNFNVHLGSHSNLIKKYNEVIKQHCLVTLNKVDCRPNITGDEKNVAVLNDTIIRDIGSSAYYHAFVIDNEHSSGEENLSTLKTRNKRKRLRLDSDSSADNESTKSKKLKKNTECSKPAVEEDNNDIQCINIDDTSSDTVDSNTIAKMGKEYDLGVINSIVNTYYNKYIKDKKGKREDNDVMLCRKLLSTGRKIMSGHGVQAPGLIKYLEQKNLALSWYPINTQIYQGMKTNYVRIITKTREKSESNLLNGWKIIKFNEDLIYDEESEQMSAEITLNPITTEKDSLLAKLLNANPVPNPKQLPKKNNPDIQTGVTTRMPIRQLENADEIFIDLDEDNDTMLMPVIMSTESLASKSKKKVQISDNMPLINKMNKTNTSEACKSLNDSHVPRIKCKPVSELMAPTSQTFQNIINSNVPLVVTQPVISINAPILTLTSQSNVVSQLQNTMDRIIDNTMMQSANMIQVANGIGQQANTQNPPIVPGTDIHSNSSATSRAGVLSTQQLPPWSRLNSQGTPVVLPAVNANDVQPSTALTQTASTPVPPTPVPSKAAPNQPVISEAREVIMNSVYLPNMPTSKPIQYLKNVLVMHDLILLIDVNTVLSKDFVCLVKFKLEVKEASRKIILSIALFANLNQFCIKVKKLNGEEIEIESLTAFWQMEILKSFHGQVSDKIVNCANKMSPALHDYAKQFVSLLKTIELKSASVGK